jgi:carbon monoxide dehydrogenase subunit G
LREDGTWAAPSYTTNTNTHYTTHLYVGSGTAANAVTTNGNTKLALFDDSNSRNVITIKGTGTTTVTSDANGVITISSADSKVGTVTTVTAGTGLNTSAD